MSGPGIWLGDLARVLMQLRPDQNTASDVAAILGVTAAPTINAGNAAPNPPPVGMPRSRSSEGVRRTTSPSARAAPPLQVGLPDPVRVAALVAELAPRQSVGPPLRLPELAEVLGGPRGRMTQPPAGLLPPTRQRSILSALAGTLAASDELDVAAIVERLGVGAALTEVPRLSRTTTRQGLQLLIDIGPSMVAFARDQDDTRRAIELVAGPDGLEVIKFRGDPLGPAGAGKGAVWEWTRYRPPSSPRPILILSDLGLLDSSGRPSQDAWRRFAAVCHGARCPLVALVPVPPKRVPDWLARTIPVVSWDRPTAVREATAAARRAARP